LLSCAAGATGGFAGGEAGLKQYVTTGEIKLRDPNQPSQRQTSPVAVAGLLVAAGAGGGLLLNELTDVGEGALKSEILNVSRRGGAGYCTVLYCVVRWVLAGAAVCCTGGAVMCRGRSWRLQQGLVMCSVRPGVAVVADTVHEPDACCCCR
jgi:hypothetical protein